MVYKRKEENFPQFSEEKSYSSLFLTITCIILLILPKGRIAPFMSRVRVFFTAIRWLFQLL